MIGYALWLVGRIVVVLFALVTWAYCVTTYSPFAFDMFVRPQLFPWLEGFVDWHHVWFLGAFIVSVLTVVPELVGQRARENPVARIVAAAYVVTFLAVGVFLLGSPYLRLLSTTTRGPFTAFVALVPLFWLAVIDILATRRTIASAIAGREPTGERHLLLAALSATVVICLTHFVHAWMKSPSIRDGNVWLIGGAWSFALDLTAYSILFVILCLAVTIGRTRKTPMAWEFGIAAVALTVGVAEFCRRLVFPSLAFADRDGALIAAGFALTMTAVWCGFRMRAAVRHTHVRLDAALLLSPQVDHGALNAVFLILVPIAAFAITNRFEQIDWDFLNQKSVTLVEALMVFGLCLRLIRTTGRSSSMWWIAGLPALSILLLMAVPLAAGSAEVVRDRYTVADAAFRLTADAFVERRAKDEEYATALRAAAEKSLDPIPSIPVISQTTTAPSSERPRPNIFLFVIDGLRRDYISPYNPAVPFTPALGEWARDAFVFQNAFTKYGGTWLAMPSIWSGAPVRRGWSRGGFDRMNALEKLIVDHRYKFVINDFTVAGHLRDDTVRTFLDPQIKSVDTDICRNIEGIRTELDGAKGEPVFAFMAPMNVYVLNSSHSEMVDGFRTGYANNVERVDRCFGEFVSFLKQRGQYDDSIISVTSDHGESLGEDGNFGHQFFLFPEDVRIPLIVSVPPRLRAGLTTDLGRIAFSSDIVSTLYRLLGYDTRELGDLFGSPLVTTQGSELTDRRRKPYVVMSSYGASYGMLRRNGKFLYISDLINYREYRFELFTQPRGSRVSVTDDLRRVNQALIRQQVAAIADFYTPR